MIEVPLIGNVFPPGEDVRFDPAGRAHNLLLDRFPPDSSW